MPYLVGFGLAFLTFAFIRWAQMDHDRAVYPVLVVVVASYYVLFATMAGATHATVVESVVTTVFAIAAVAGFRFNLWLVAAALAGHGAFDSVHANLVANPGVPLWWPAFCGTYDITLAVCLGWLLYTRKVQPKLLTA